MLASAISPATSKLHTRVRPSDAEDVRPPAFSASFTSARGDIQRGNQSENQGGADRDQQREDQRAGIHADRRPHDLGAGLRHGKRAGQDRAQQVDAPDGEEDSQRASHQAQQQAFAENLRDQTAAPRAQCRANRHFLAPAGDARQQQAGHVDAGQQQQKSHRAQQQQQRGPDVFEQRLFHPHHGNIPTRQPGRLRIDAARDGAQLGLRLGDRDARLQARDDAEIVVHAVLGAQLRDRPRHVKVAGQRMPEIRSEHADHGVRLAVHDERPADDARVRCRSGASNTRSVSTATGYRA